EAGPSPGAPCVRSSRRASHGGVERVRLRRSPMDDPGREDEDGPAAQSAAISASSRHAGRALSAQRQVAVPFPELPIERARDLGQYDERGTAPARLRQDRNDRAWIPRDGEQSAERKPQVASRRDRAPARPCGKQRRSARVSARRALERTRSDDAVLVGLSRPPQGQTEAIEAENLARRAVRFGPLAAGQRLQAAVGYERASTHPHRLKVATAYQFVE